MKKVLGIALSAVVLFCALPLAQAQAQAQEYGKIRALNQRAAYVLKQKNDFVVRVLTSYQILHEINEQGAVIRIYVGDKWLAIKAIEIVPVLTESADKSRQVSAHELFFFTDDGILDVTSALTIR